MIIRNICYCFQGNRQKAEACSTPSLLHMGGHQLQKLFQTLPDTGEDNDKCARALDNYFDVKKPVPKERQNFMSTSLEGKK